MSLAYDCVSDTFDLDSRLSSSISYVVGIKNSVADLVDQVVICFILCESNFDTASSVFASQMMRAIDWSKVSSVAVSRWLSFEYRLVVVRELLAVEKALVTIDGRSKFVPLAPFLEAFFPHRAPKWTDAR